MNKRDLQDVVNRLEAIEALAKLFNNLWFDQIKKNISDEKVQAYLLVFEDAFPHVNHVIEFVRRSAGMLSESSGGVSESSTEEQWGKLSSEFESLRGLLQGEVQTRPVTEPPSLLPQEQEALEAVGQSDLDSLFDEGPADEEAAIDALFDAGSGNSTPTAVQDIDELFSDADEDEYELEDEEEEEDEEESIGAEMIDESEDLDEDDALEAAEARPQTAVSEAEVPVPADDEDELAELMQGVDEDDMTDEDVDLGDLLEEEEEEDGGEEDAELDGLFKLKTRKRTTAKATTWPS